MIGAALTVYSFKFIFSYRNEWPLLRGFDLSLFPILGLMQFSHNLFVHTNIKLNFGYLNYVFISPHLHQFHHGAESKYHHKNYGVFLSIWDQMFGTFINEKNVSVNFGVAGHQRKDMVATILEPIRPSIPEN